MSLLLLYARFHAVDVLGDDIQPLQHRLGVACDERAELLHELVRVPTQPRCADCGLHLGVLGTQLKMQ